MYPVEFVPVPAPRWVETHSEAEECLSYLSEHSSGMPIAVDTETTGTDRNKDIVVCWSLSDGKRRYVLTAGVLPYFENFLKYYPFIVFHNANFDSAMLRTSGIDMDVRRKLGRRIDTMVMHHWIDQTLPHKLEWIAAHELGLWKISYKDTFGKTKAGSAELIDPLQFGDPSYRAKVAEYASWDAYLTILAWMKFDTRLKKLGLAKPYYEYETKFQDAVYLMERNGVQIDVARLSSWAPIYEGMLTEIQESFNKAAGEFVELDTNLKSPKQLVHFFYDVLKLEPPRMHKKKNGPKGRSTAEPIIKAWAKGGNEFAQMLLKYRNLNQQKQTYVDGLLSRVKSNCRLYSDFTLDVAATGRLSSTNPNLQNIVGDDKILDELKKRGISFRDVFVAPQGYDFFDFDYNQLEMCIGAHLSRDKVLIDSIRAGKDMHSFTASKMLGVPYEAVLRAKAKSDDKDWAGREPFTPAEQEYLKARKAAKVINFGVLYGEGPQGLADQAKITEEEAEAYIAKFFKEYPGVERYVFKMEQHARKVGWVPTLLGRRRIIEGANSIDRTLQGEAKRQAINTPIQGTASDILRAAMIKLCDDRVLIENGVNMVLQIHDELLFEVPHDTDPRVVKHIEETMSHPFDSDLLVPLTASGHKGATWATAK